MFAFFLFQMVFMDTTLTIPTGALAERWKFSSFCIFTVFLGAIIYPVFGNWAWGGGWLSALGRNVGLGNGYVDFAGSRRRAPHGRRDRARHLQAARTPAREVQRRTARANVIPGHNIPMAIYGTFVLAFGWFGFNAGSTLAGTDVRIGVVATNTMLAGAAGAISAMAWVWMKYGKPDPSMLANGMLAGLVAITAPCAFVTAPSAVAIGLIAGVLVCWAVVFFERTLKLDDPVGAISVHGVNGAWGVLAVGLFADGTYGGGLNGVTGNVTGLLYGGTTQIVAQLIGIVANFVMGRRLGVRGVEDHEPRHQRQPRLRSGRGARARHPGDGRARVPGSWRHDDGRGARAFRSALAQCPRDGWRLIERIGRRTSRGARPLAPTTACHPDITRHSRIESR